ncbi:MAG: LysR family transcriptional regulator [Schwartzia sp.]|nr:LysR family transcriptional regulator [Schwartzia sp. (in: firmicutes)]
MNIHQLTYFLDLAETLSFTQTARNFFVSQTAITQQIKSLEDKLGVQLFERTKRRVQLTPAGQIFVNEARGIIAKIETSVARTRAVSTGFNGALTLGYIAGFSHTRFPEFLRAFYAQYPNINLTLQSGSIAGLYEGLQSGAYDAIFTLAFDIDKQYLTRNTYQEMGTSSMFVVLPASHPMAGASSLTLAKIKDEPFICYDNAVNGRSPMNGSPVRPAAFNQNLRPTCLTGDVETIFLMVSMGLGISVLPECFRPAAPPKAELAFIPLTGAQNRMSLIVAWNPENENPARQKLNTALTSFMAQK